MKVSLILLIVGFLLIVDSFFEITRKFGLKIPRKISRLFASVGLILIVIALFISQRGL